MLGDGVGCKVEGVLRVHRARAFVSGEGVG